MTPITGAERISRRMGMAVGQRLLLGLAPSLLAVVLVVALAYYGELGREAPEYIVSGAGLLAVVSLLLTWWNTRYLVARIRRLGGQDVASEHGESMLDDLDRIEGEVTRRHAALFAETTARAAERTSHVGRIQESATMLAAAVRGMTAQLDEVRLPLHILLDARFGELNENQEELLVAARGGADEIDAALRRLAVVADADRGALVLRREPVSANDVLRAILPMVRASADRVSASVELSLEPALPRVWANRSALAEAVALLATRAVEALDSGARLRLATMSTSSACELRLHPWCVGALGDAAVMAATRSLESQDVHVARVDEQLVVQLPRVSVASTAAR